MIFGKIRFLFAKDTPYFSIRSQAPKIPSLNETIQRDGLLTAGATKVGIKENEQGLLTIFSTTHDSFLEFSCVLKNVIVY